MPYQVHSIFYTLQGEGAQVGRPALFCRFAGCNLWSGREADRALARCRFCDTDFQGTTGLGGGHFSDPAALVAALCALWPPSPVRPYVVCTGGEPSLQLDPPLLAAFHAAGCDVAVETNGTMPLPPGIDWVCVSPKAGTQLVVQAGDELKLVFPQDDLNPDDFTALPFRHFFLQPLDDTAAAAHTQAAIAYCLAHPHWRLSLQMHKVLGIR